MFLKVNHVLEDKETNNLYRVLWFNKGSNICFLIKLSKDKNQYPQCYKLDFINSLIENESYVFSDDPYLTNDTVLTEKQIERAKYFFSILDPVFGIGNQPDVFLKNERGKVIKALIECYGMSKETAYRLYSRYFQGGQTYLGLAPKYHERGRLKVENLQDDGGESTGKVIKVSKKAGRKSDEYGNGVPGPECYGLFDYAIKHYHLAEKQTLADAHKKLVRVHFRGIAIDDTPTITQFYNYNKNHFSQESYLKRKMGHIVFNKKYRAHFSNNLSRVHGPGHIFEIDATIGDVYILSDYYNYHQNDDLSVWAHDPVIIGRPVIYHVIDVFSRLIVGIYVGVHGPSWHGAAMALRNVMEDKQAYCEQFGVTLGNYEDPEEGITVDNMFPSFVGIPTKLVTDTGCEYRGEKPQGLVDSLGIRLENSKVYHPELKGGVEQSFNRSQQDGRIFNVKQSKRIKDEVLRNAPNPKKTACYTLKEFTGTYIRKIIQMNTTPIDFYPRSRAMIADDVPKIPARIFEWGVANTTGSLRIPPIKDFDIACLPRKKVSVTNKGIRLIHDIYYCFKNSDDQKTYQNWFLKYNAGKKKVTIAYDPLNLSYAFILPEEHSGCCLELMLTPASKERYSDVSYHDACFLIKTEKYETVNLKYRQNQKDIITEEIETIHKDISKRVPKGGHKAKTWENMKEHRDEQKNNDLKMVEKSYYEDEASHPDPSFQDSSSAPDGTITEGYQQIQNNSSQDHLVLSSEIHLEAPDASDTAASDLPILSYRERLKNARKNARSDKG